MNRQTRATASFYGLLNCNEEWSPSVILRKSYLSNIFLVFLSQSFEESLAWQIRNVQKLYNVLFFIWISQERKATVCQKLLERLEKKCFCKSLVNEFILMDPKSNLHYIGIILSAHTSFSNQFQYILSTSWVKRYCAVFSWSFRSQYYLFYSSPEYNVTKKNYKGYQTMPW